MQRRAFIGGMTVAASTAALGGVPWPAGWTAAGRRVTRLDAGWKFLRDDPARAERPDFDDGSWAPVSLPHTARIEALVTGKAGSPEAQWQGICWYRRRLEVEAGNGGDQVLLRFEGAMNVAEVWLDGERIGGHLGGYLPFVLDLGDRLTSGPCPHAGRAAGQSRQPDDRPQAARPARFQRVPRALPAGLPGAEGPPGDHRSAAGGPPGERRGHGHLPDRSRGRPPPCGCRATSGTAARSRAHSRCGPPCAAPMAGSPPPRSRHR